MRLLRVVACTGSVGHGHTRAAEAIAQAVRELDDAQPSSTPLLPTGAPPFTEVEVTIIDALLGAPKWFLRSYRDAYLAFVSKVPAAAGFLYKASDRPPKAPRRRSKTGAFSRRGLGLALERKAMKHFLARPELASADVVVCTHFLCARVLSDLKIRGGLPKPLIVCVTDQHPHGIWLVPGATRILVASEEARQEAIQAGISKEKVVVTGIPLDKRFRNLPDKATARQQLGLPPDKPIALVCGGGLGLGGVEPTVRSLLRATRPGGVHVIAVCGQNATSYAELETLLAEGGHAPNTCSLFGFTHQMAELMAASDVMIGKPGGMSSAEAAAAGLPMVLLKPLPGQEDHNASRLLRLGAAVLEKDPARAGQVAAELLDDHQQLAKMRTGALVFAGATQTDDGTVAGPVGIGAVRAARVIAEVCTEHSMQPTA